MSTYLANKSIDRKGANLESFFEDPIGTLKATTKSKTIDSNQAI